MPNYDPDPMVTEAFGYWSQNPEAEWASYIPRFAAKSKAERVEVLRMADQWLQEPKPTKEHAAMWSRKRELENLHWRLDRLGK